MSDSQRTSKELVAKAIERLSRGYFAACVRDREKCGYVMGNVSVADLVDVFEFAVAAIKSEPIAAKQAYVLANFVFETQAWKAARYPSEGDALKSACVVLRAMERAAHEPPPVQVDEFPPCMIPPFGWICTREPGHDGPCAAVFIEHEAAEQIERFKVAIKAANRAYVRIVMETAKTRHAPPPSAVPALDDEVRWILGRPNFACASIAEGLRAGGHTIERKAEHEQAAVIHWMLTMYVKHGAEWRGKAENELHEMRQGLTKGMHPNCTDPCPICDHEVTAVRHSPTKSAGAS
jgi:hypothetical protein